MMTNDMTGCMWRRQRWATERRWAPVIVGALIWLAAGPAPAASADEGLAWKFKPGETLRFTVEQKEHMSVRGGGTENRSSRTTVQDISWRVRAVYDNGEAEITHRLDRLRMRVEQPPLMPFDFDSASTKEPQPGFEPIVKSLKSSVGGEFTFRIKATGEIVDIKLPEEMLKQIRESAQQQGGGEPVSEDQIKQALMQQESPPSFPEGPLEPGKTWSPRAARVPLPPFAMLNIDRTFTYQGPDPKRPNLRLVDIQSTAKVTPMEGSDIKLTVRKQEGKGGMVLDADLGRLISTRMDLKLDLSITAKGQSIEQSTEVNSSMTLQP